MNPHQLAERYATDTVRREVVRAVVEYRAACARYRGALVDAARARAAGQRVPAESYGVRIRARADRDGAEATLAKCRATEGIRAALAVERDARCWAVAMPLTGNPGGPPRGMSRVRVGDLAARRVRVELWAWLKAHAEGDPTTAPAWAEYMSVHLDATH